MSSFFHSCSKCFRPRSYLPAVQMLTCALALTLAQAQAGPSAKDGDAARAQQGESRQSPFMHQRDKVVAAARVQDWTGAERDARRLLEVADQGGNPYEQIDAAELLMLSLHNLQQYSQAVDVAQNMLDAARAQPENTINGQVDALVWRGLLEAVAAQDAAAMVRIQQSLREESRAYPGLWQWDEAQARLQYRAAQISLPLSTGRWVLVKLSPAKRRQDMAWLQYLYQGADDARLIVHLGLRYRESQGQDPLRSLHEDASETGVPDFGLSFIPQSDPQKRFARLSDADKKSSLQHWDWMARRGHWEVELNAEFLPKLADLARARLPELFAAIEWKNAPDLPAHPLQQQGEDSMLAQWHRGANWPAVGKNAAQLQSHAVFPTEIASGATLQGIAAYKQGQWDAANKALTLALQTWPYASLGRGEEDLEENAQQFGADLALRQGRTQDATRMMRQYLRNAGGLERVWALDPDPAQASLHNQRTGQVLPLWAHGFYLQQPMDSQRLLYRNLVTEDQLGLTTGLKIPESDEVQEKLLRQALEKQFRLQAGTLKKQSFSPKPRSDGKVLKGQQWVFEIKPAEQGAGTSQAVRRMAFWIVDQGKTRAMLRAPLSNAQQEQRALHLALALGW